VAEVCVKLSSVNSMKICSAVLERLYVFRRTDSDFGMERRADLRICKVSVTLEIEINVYLLLAWRFSGIWLFQTKEFYERTRPKACKLSDLHGSTNHGTNLLSSVVLTSEVLNALPSYEARIRGQK
jgi:hypothetical protein